MADMSRVGQIENPEEIIAEIALAPGIPAWYDSSNGFHLTISNPTKKIKRKNNRLFILKAIKFGLIRKLWGVIPESKPDNKKIAPVKEVKKVVDKVNEAVKVDVKKEVEAPTVVTKEIEKTIEPIKETEVALPIVEVVEEIVTPIEVEEVVIEEEKVIPKKSTRKSSKKVKKEETE